MKRTIAAMLALVLLICPAIAEGLANYGAWSQALSETYGAKWKEEGDVCVLKADQDVTISACLSGKDVVAVTVEAVRDSGLREAAYAAIAALMGADSEVLLAIEELEGLELTVGGCVVGHLAGEKRECIYIASEEDFNELIWEPVYGGKRLHKKPGCSGMDVPRLITAEAGKKTGYDPCGRCMKNAGK